jgi:hypothetical protein
VSLDELPDQVLEARLAELAFAEGVGGRALEAQKSAIRTLLARRDGRRPESEIQAGISRAVELVNAHRGRADRVTAEEMDDGWAASIVREPRWAEVFATEEECRVTAAAGRRGRTRAIR